MFGGNARSQHSSLLLWTFLTYGRRKFYNIGPTQGYKTFYGRKVTPQIEAWVGSQAIKNLARENALAYFGPNSFIAQPPRRHCRRWRGSRTGWTTTRSRSLVPGPTSGATSRRWRGPRKQIRQCLEKRNEIAVLAVSRNGGWSSVKSFCV